MIYTFIYKRAYQFLCKVLRKKSYCWYQKSVLLIYFNICISSLNLMSDCTFCIDERFLVTNWRTDIIIILTRYITCKQKTNWFMIEYRFWGIELIVQVHRNSNNLWVTISEDLKSVVMSYILIKPFWIIFYPIAMCLHTVSEETNIRYL